MKRRHSDDSPPPAVVFTVGHGVRTLDEFVQLLRAAEVKVAVDVRAHPGSRRCPHWNREALRQSLRDAGLRYEHIAELGGRRRLRKGQATRHTALTHPSFAAYAEHMDGAEFSAGLDQLERLARAETVAFFCSETVWWRCHRRMIADALTAAGWIVRHLGIARSPPQHALWNVARADNAGGAAIVYDVRVSQGGPRAAE